MSTPFKKITQNLPFHDFEKEPSYIGLFNEVITLGEEKKFEVAIFTDLDSLEQRFITLSHAIEKSLRQIAPENGSHVFEITFKGKTEINGKPFNKFDVGACTLIEYDKFMSESTKKAKK